jgi:hypothetical protein
VFEKLWQETGCQAVLRDLLRGRRFEFPVERAVFLTVLHRLLASRGRGHAAHGPAGGLMPWKDDRWEGT